MADLVPVLSWLVLASLQVCKSESLLVQYLMVYTGDLFGASPVSIVGFRV